jgi:hypothetical protein
MSVCTNSSNIQTDILSEALYDVAKIHTEFKSQREVDGRKGKIYLIDSKTIHK